MARRQKTILKAGDKTTIPKLVRHKFKNESGSTVIVNITIEPGYKPFEQNIEVMMGLQKDGLIEQLSKMTPKMIPVGLILTDLSNTKLVGGIGFMLKVMSLFYSKEKIALRKKELMDKYCSDQEHPCLPISVGTSEYCCSFVNGG